MLISADSDVLYIRSRIQKRFVSVAAGGWAAGSPEEAEADRRWTGQILRGSERRSGETGAVWEESCRRELRATHANIPTLQVRKVETFLCLRCKWAIGYSQHSFHSLLNQLQISYIEKISSIRAVAKTKVKYVQSKKKRILILCNYACLYTANQRCFNKWPKQQGLWVYRINMSCLKVFVKNRLICLLTLSGLSRGKISLGIVSRSWNPYLEVYLWQPNPVCLLAQHHMSHWMSHKCSSTEGNVKFFKFSLCCCSCSPTFYYYILLFANPG